MILITKTRLNEQKKITFLTYDLHMQNFIPGDVEALKSIFI